MRSRLIPRIPLSRYLTWISSKQQEFWTPKHQSTTCTNVSLHESNSFQASEAASKQKPPEKHQVTRLPWTVSHFGKQPPQVIAITEKKAASQRAAEARK